jgi:hypothetical protein
MAVIYFREALHSIKYGVPSSIDIVVLIVSPVHEAKFHCMRPVIRSMLFQVPTLHAFNANIIPSGV